MNSSPPPVACSLSTKDAAAQALEWVDLRTHLVDSEALSTGVRMRFPIDYRAALEDLVRRESACCTFLDIATKVDGVEFEVTITSTNPDALPVIALLGGVSGS